uniref:Uncharacterized protein n=1 Tax=Catharus ustulatus TaxID=91951 RepID=A0A8C3V3D2_CATUS
MALSWLAATSRPGAHVTSHPTPKASHLEPSSPDVWGGWRGGSVHTPLHPAGPGYRCRDVHPMSSPTAEAASESCWEKHPEAKTLPHTDTAAPTPRALEHRCSSGRRCSAARWQRLGPGSSCLTPGQGGSW